MSLESRLLDLLNQTGLDNKNLKQLPSYAKPQDRFRRYNAQMTVYNARGSNLRRSRNALAKAASRTGKFNIIAAGDSGLVGTNGAKTIDRFSIPKQLGLSLARMSGAPLDGGLSVPPAATNTLTDRWVVASGTVYQGYPFLMMYAASVVYYESEQAGTDVTLWYTNNSGPFTYSIDGAAPVTVTPPGGAATGTDKVIISGLPDTTHFVAITAGVTYVYLMAASVTKQYGISVHNLAYGGSRAALGTDNAWTNGTAGTSLKMSREILRQTPGFPDPDLLLYGIGANDLFQGDIAANVLNGLRTMRSWWPNAEVILTGGVFFSGTNATEADALSAGKYALAEEFDGVYVDNRDLMKDFAWALANGALGPDNAHPIHGLQQEMGRQLAEIISGSGAISGQYTPETIFTKGNAIGWVGGGMDHGIIRCTSAAANVLNVPTFATDPIPIGFVVEGVQYGAGQVTITPQSGVTLRSAAGLKTNGQYAVFGLRKIGTDEWAVYGDLTT